MLHPLAYLSQVSIAVVKLLRFNYMFRLYAVALSIAYDFLSDFDDGSTNELNILLAKYLGILASQLKLIKTKMLVKLQFETYISQEQYDRKVKSMTKHVKKLEFFCP